MSATSTTIQTEVKNTVNNLISDLLIRTEGARIIPDTETATLGGRYAVSIHGVITDLTTGLPVPCSSGTGQIQHRLMQVKGSKSKQLGITAQRAMALAFFGVEAVGKKFVHLIDSSKPLSLGNLQVCNSHLSTAGGVHLKCWGVNPE